MVRAWAQGLDTLGARAWFYSPALFWLVVAHRQNHPSVSSFVVHYWLAIQHEGCCS